MSLLTTTYCMLKRFMNQAQSWRIVGRAGHRDASGGGLYCRKDSLLLHKGGYQLPHFISFSEFYFHDANGFVI